MPQEQKKQQEADEQKARELDIAETLSRLSERNQAMLEGFARGLMASDVKRAG